MKCDEPMSRQQISKDTGSFADELESLLAPLFHKQLIKQNEDTMLSLTFQGEDVLSKLWPIVELSEEKILHNFSDQEKQAFFDYLDRVQHNCLSML